MPFLGLFEWIDGLPSSIALRQSLNAYPVTLAFHLVSMTVFAGLIAFWDMRLVGIALRSVPVSRITERIFPWMIAAFVVCIGTGLLLVYSQPMRYYDNFYLWVKMLFFVLAGLNAGLFHITSEKTVHTWETDPVTPRGAQIAGVASLFMWAIVILAGRMTAYSAMVPDWWVAMFAGN